MKSGLFVSCGVAAWPGACLCKHLLPQPALQPYVPVCACLQPLRHGSAIRPVPPHDTARFAGPDRPFRRSGQAVSQRSMSRGWLHPGRCRLFSASGSPAVVVRCGPQGPSRRTLPAGAELSRLLAARPGRRPAGVPPAQPMRTKLPFFVRLSRGRQCFFSIFVALNVPDSGACPQCSGGAEAEQKQENAIHNLT